LVAECNVPCINGTQACGSSFGSPITGSDVEGPPSYDTLFVELAVRERKPLVAFDARLLAAFPDVAARPGGLAN
jgi:hypothetical protein